jgi:hypothetical protein
MDNNKIFADGIIFKLPTDKAPNWIKGNITINIEKFTEFIKSQSNERGWINLDVKESKNGTLYVELNTYQKPKNTPTSEVNTKNDELPY